MKILILLSILLPLSLQLIQGVSQNDPSLGFGLMMEKKSSEIKEKLKEEKKWRKYELPFEKIISSRKESTLLSRLDTSHSDYVFIDEEWDLRQEKYRFRERHFYLNDSINDLFPSRSLGFEFYPRVEFFDVVERRRPSTSERHYIYDELTYLIYGSDLFTLKNILYVFEDSSEIRRMPPHIYLAEENCSGDPYQSIFAARKVRRYRFQTPFVRVRTLINRNSNTFRQFFEIPVKARPHLILGP